LTKTNVSIGFHLGVATAKLGSVVPILVLKPIDFVRVGLHSHCPAIAIIPRAGIGL
jgi:hypothetical protein